MKRKYFTNLLFGSAAVCCTLSLQTATAGTPAATTPAPAAEPAAATNSIGFAVGGVATYGDKAAFQRRFQQNGDFYGGISNLNWASDVGDGMTLSLEGHALFGLEDYGFLGTLAKDDVGYVQFGFKQFRTWYDGSGGYRPPNQDTWVPLWDDDLSVDRGSLWFEAGLRMENLPEFTFRYSHDWRDGTKDSTSWGGALGNPSYKTIPALTLIDETTDTFRLDFTHTLGTTDFGGGVSYQSIRNDDTRVERNGASGSAPTLGTRVADTANYDSDIFNGYLFSQTRFGDKLALNFGYSFTSFDTDLGGDRPSVDNPTGALLTGSDHALWGIMGGNQGTTNVLNANLLWNPIECLSIVPSLRAEYWDNNGWSSHVGGRRNNNVVAEGGLTPAEIVGDALGGVFPPVGSANYGDLEDFRTASSDDYEEYTEGIEARYTGFDNVLIYGEMEFTQLDGHLARWESENFYNGAGVAITDRYMDSEINKQQYTLGANWYPCSGVSLAGQVYYKRSDAFYNNSPLGTEDPFLRQSNYDTTDFNLRLTWRILPNLTSVTRYDYQQTDFESQGFRSGALVGVVDSADISANVFSQSLTWMPIDRAYVQGFVSYTDATTDTPGDVASPAMTTDSDNDYLTLSLTAGYVIDDKTDITASYAYYYADNYALPTTGMGYGTGIEENVFSVSLNRQLSTNMVWSLGYAYYTGNDDSVNGWNDYSAHMFSTGLQIRF